ncbi:DUF4785 family protein [Shewanella eurypsychrophilus]|uniref:DUF4785 family protein n=1 Tax=Shewanella eurypsychrophilus TaxID=2593656 RepID=A0ABX6V2P7_9GAMM|nr:MULTISPECIES: DUF4785 domain-containing protein [Shewanella]QFU21513.1 DUF4785 family protein [Shewanella sp. YLB-09]QPG56803.1 DUF4785 family protein [Shewanella eurypsychrophilus]
MKNLTLILMTLSLSQLLTACQDEATTQTADVEVQSFTTASLSAPQQGDFSASEIEAPQLPPINNNRESLSFISTPSKTANIAAPTNTHSSISDEYWKTVSGAELNHGINLAISQTSSVIRISPRADTSSGALIHSKAIAPSNIQLYKVDKKSTVNKSSSYIHSMADADALATAGLTDNSSALTMSASAKPGQYQLKISQPLPVTSSYLVNVKEKQSPYQLSLSGQTRVSSLSNHVDFDLQLSNSDNKFTPQASLKHPNGRYQTLNVKSVNGQWQAELPESYAMPNSNAGLSELQIDIQTKVNGLDVIRTVKTAFKQYVPSAKLQQQVNTLWLGDVPQSISFNLDIAIQGRFALSAYITGTDMSGQDHIILKTASASWLTQANPNIDLKLDPQLILDSGLIPPFKLKGLELKDQGQMARLSYQQDALILEK